MKIAWLSDFDLRGSGYLNISTPICNGLAAKGHEIKALGLGYTGEEHFNDFMIIPCKNFQEMNAMIKNFQTMWKFDVLVVALDIPVQERVLIFLRDIERFFKYVGIMPLESDPLVMDWAMVLMQMDKVFIISEFGTEEVRKKDVEAEHLQIGIDTGSWRMPTAEERTKIRSTMFGVEDDAFLVLTVADNQERKNLSKAMEIFAEFAVDKDNVRYVLVTREHIDVGWKLRTMATDLGFGSKLMLFERGIPFKQLWSIYAACDCFMLTSKAEGLGMPLLEAMSVGLPCLATNCTGMRELLSDGRGFLLEYLEECVYIDPFGNGHRYVVNVESGIENLDFLYHKDDDRWTKGIRTKAINNARKYVEGRTWDIAIEQVDKALRKYDSSSELNPALL